MNIALTHHHSRSSVFWRARHCVAAAALCAGLIGAVAAAPGGEPGRRDEASAQQGQPHYGRGAEPGRAEPGRADARGADARGADARGDEARHVAAETARRNNRLTPDERRDLRRQINEAGQDIYAAPPRR